MELDKYTFNILYLITRTSKRLENRWTMELEISINNSLSHSQEHTLTNTTLSLSLVLPLGREHTPPPIHFSVLLHPFQVYTSLEDHVQRSLEQTEVEGPRHVAFIHAVFD